MVCQWVSISTRVSSRTRSFLRGGIPLRGGLSFPNVEAAVEVAVEAAAVAEDVEVAVEDAAVDAVADAVEVVAVVG